MSASRQLAFDQQQRLTANRMRPADILKKSLTVVQANSKELLDQVFRLRFQVYCLERSFEDPAEHPDRRERDDDDFHSTHFLVLYRNVMAAEARAVGTVRLILPRRGTLLPVFRLVTNRELHRVDLPIETTAEVSRFAVPRSFRTQLQHDLRNELNAAAEKILRRALELLNFWLVRAVTRMTASSGITHIVAMMEPALLRLLRRLGIDFHPLGDMVEYHGLRQPVWVAMGNLTDRIRQCQPELWEIAFDAEWDLPGAPAFAYG